ncbi:MAG: hypothetical protein V8S95_07580 [Odoribacter sp.]
MQNTPVPNSNDFTLRTQNLSGTKVLSYYQLHIKNSPYSSPVQWPISLSAGKSRSGKIVIAGKKHTLESMTLVVLAPEYISQLVDISPDFRCNLLLITKSFLDSLPASDKIYRRIAKMMLQQQQVNKLNKQQYLVLSESIHTIQEKNESAPPSPETRNHPNCLYDFLA